MGLNACYLCGKETASGTLVETNLHSFVFLCSVCIRKNSSIKSCENCTSLHVRGGRLCYTCSENIKACYCCGGLQDKSNMQVINEKRYCQNCSEKATNCTFCGKSVIGSELCDHCKEFTRPCFGCEVRHKKIDMHLVDNGRYFYCEECCEDMNRCEFCGKPTFNDRYCGHCLRHTEDCYGCGERFNHNSLYSFEGEYYCAKCREELIVIRDYEYVPDVFSFQKEPGEGDIEQFFGIELEIDEGGESNSNARRLENITDDIYFVHDGSLNDGFEIVSHPCTFEYHTTTLPWLDVIKAAIDMGYTSHDARTCGLHIHVSTKSFGSNPQERDQNLMKILYLYEVLWDDILKFSRRTETQIERWAGKYLNSHRVNNLKDKGCSSEEADSLLKLAKDSGRYYAVNLQNDNTVEFRIFRGTLKFDTFLATLQFTKNMCDLVCNTNIRDIQSVTMADICSYREFDELNKYLAERGLESVCV